MAASLSPRTELQRPVWFSNRKKRSALIAHTESGYESFLGNRDRPIFPHPFLPLLLLLQQLALAA